jgi:hypothetical protein
MAANSFRRLLDDDQQAHRLVNLDHLPGQAGAQVGIGAFHDPEEAGDVVRDLRAAAEALVIDGRKIVFER